jgi:hypothetical protein
MKARELKRLLNNTGYAVHNKKDSICVGSAMCSDLISVDKTTLNVKYALDTFHEGREALGNDELRFIWDKLLELIDNGQIQDIINGKDVIENPLPVYSFDDNGIVKSYTDEYGWPNVDDDGVLMYENVFFATEEEAIEQAIDEYTASVSHYYDRVRERSKELGELKAKLIKKEDILAHFIKLKNE